MKSSRAASEVQLDSSGCGDRPSILVPRRGEAKSFGAQAGRIAKLPGRSRSEHATQVRCARILNGNLNSEGDRIASRIPGKEIVAAACFDQTRCARPNSSLSRTVFACAAPRPSPEPITPAHPAVSRPPSFDPIGQPMPERDVIKRALVIRMVPSNSDGALSFVLRTRQGNFDVGKRIPGGDWDGHSWFG